MIYKHERLVDSQLEWIRSCLTTRPPLTDKLYSIWIPWMIRNHSTHNFSFIDGYIPGTLSAYFSSNVPHLLNSRKKKRARPPTIHSKWATGHRNRRIYKQNPLNFKTHGDFVWKLVLSLCLSLPIRIRMIWLQAVSQKARSRGAGSRCINRLRPVSHSPLTIVCPCGALRQQRNYNTQTLIVWTFLFWHDPLIWRQRSPNAHSSGVKGELSFKAGTLAREGK